MTYASEVLADSPLAYWRLGDATDVTMADSSGNGRHGAYYNIPTVGAGSLLVSDPVDTAVDFNGVDHFGYVDYSAWMNQAAFTVEALFRPDSVTGSHVIAARHNTSGSGDVTFLLRTDGDRLSFYTYAGGFSVIQSAVGSVAVGTTYHAAATFDGSTATLYLNGVQVATAARSAPGVTVTPFTIGSNSGTTLEAFDGRLDEVAYYGAALSGARVAAHYAAATDVGTAEGVLTVTLPKPTVTMSGTAPTPGALAASLPLPVVTVEGSAPIPGGVAVTLPVPTFAGTGTTPPPRTGYGLVLDSTATTSAPPPVDLTSDPVDPAGVPAPVQHVVVPTVPAPVLVNGRPS